MRKKILIIGGGGYVGSALTPYLLKKGHFVSVLDLFIYGEDVLDKNKNLKKFKGDIRNLDLVSESLKNQDIVIHLACISNDPSFELNPDLGKSINYDSFRPIVELSIKNKVKQFIYASSSSVYGIKKINNVTEEMNLNPLTDYSKYKAECEKILFEYNENNFVKTILRPATVCGYARRQRLDVVVNLLSSLAYFKNEIKILGGSQLRPNIHIKDMVLAYDLLINANKNKISDKIFNVGYENKSVQEIADIILAVMGPKVKLKKEKTDDLRSYHISSEKISKDLGYKTKYTILDAVRDLKKAFDNKLLASPETNEFYYNIKRMKSINLQ